MTRTICKKCGITLLTPPWRGGCKCNEKGSHMNSNIKPSHDLFIADKVVDEEKQRLWTRPRFTDVRNCKVCEKPVTLNPLWGGCHC